MTWREPFSLCLQMLSRSAHPLVPGLWKLSASGNCPAAELPGLWLLDGSPSIESSWGQRPADLRGAPGEGGVWKGGSSKFLVSQGGHQARKGSRLPKVPQPLQINVCRLRRHQDVGIHQRHVCKGPCSPTSAGSDVHSLSPKTFQTCSSESHSTSRASSGPASTSHMHKACFLKHPLPCCTGVNLFFFFFGKLVLDLGTVKRNCRHIKRRLFVFCLFLDRASDVFIWRLGSHSLSHYLQLILCFLWATFKSMSNEKYCLILKYVVL